MRENYITTSSEREFYVSEVREELNYLYDEISTTQELENEETEEK